MTLPEDIINDVKFFISLWKEVGKKIKDDSDILSKEYGITNEEYDYEGGSYFFTTRGIKYKWDGNEEELYNVTKRIIINSGLAYEYVIKNNNNVKNAYDIIETEMIKRGWYYDREEYEYFISKNGWSTTLPYFCESIEDISEFEWDAEMME
jgi:hypothetical protein